MKSLVCGLFVCFLLCGCPQAQENGVNDTKVQQLIDRTLKNMVFVKSGSYMMGDPGDKLMQAFGDQAFKYYLPTESQWEYAARSRGKLVPFATDTGFINRGRNYPPSVYDPLPIGQYHPNPLGLRDMSGNAYEWVLDWYDPEYCSRSPEKNPRGPETGIKKVVRGGG